MNIEQLALEAGLVYQGHKWCDADRKQIGRFAALVRNEVLEEAALMCDAEAAFLKSDNDGGSSGCGLCASAIRSMKGKT